MMTGEEEVEDYLLPFSHSPTISEWTPFENKLFENALGVFGDDEPARWEKIAKEVPGKTPEQVEKHYQLLVEDIKFIDSGQIPIPHYLDDNEDGEEMWDEEQEEEEQDPDSKDVKGKGSSSGKKKKKDTKPRKKGRGISWSEEEHRLFLMGLNKYGKGDWRSISRNYVVTRTPTQVASHAQKYFNRVNNVGMKPDRCRPSIHDIRNVNEPQFPPFSHMNFVPMMRSMIQTSNKPATEGGFCRILPRYPPPSFGSFGNYVRDAMEAYPSNNFRGDVGNFPNTFRGGPSGPSSFDYSSMYPL